MTGSRWLAIAVLSLAPVLAGAAQAEILHLPRGIAVDLPEGWRLDGPLEGKTGSDGRTRVQLVCETPDCKQTQETCTFLFQAERRPGADDATRLKALYESPFDRYLRIRAVLKATSQDAEVLQPLGLTDIGGRPWYLIKTDARHNYKSGLFAETVVDGWYLGVICKTCETGKLRHQAGRGMIESVRPAD
jgi:hypothetical protein